MRAALMLIASASASLLLVAAWNRNELESLAGLDDGDTTSNDWVDEVNAAIAAAKNAVMPAPVAGMVTSGAGLQHLQKSEALRLVRYRLGDGGWTIGWGRYYPA